MKILCVIDSLGSGGAQRQLVNLAVGFQVRGHEVAFLIYHDLSFYRELLDRHNIPVVLIEAKNPIQRFFKMRSFIRKGHFDVVQTFLEVPSFLCELSAFPFKKWKLVVGERSANPAILHSWKKRFLRFFHFFADAIVANSYKNIEYVLMANPFLKKKKCHVIYNAVKVEERAVDKKELSDSKCLVVAASHQYSKNLEGLLQALEMLDQAEASKLRVCWYGDFAHYSYEEACKKIVGRGLRSVISLHKASVDIHRVMAGAQGVGLFSFHEGFPNTVCEGMSLGKPVVCSNVSDIPRLLGEANDLLFNPKDSVAIKESIRRWLNMTDEELERVGRNNKVIAESNFDLDKNVERYLELYNEKVSG